MDEQRMRVDEGLASCREKRRRRHCHVSNALRQSADGFRKGIR